MFEENLENIVEGNRKVMLMSRDRANKYKFSQIEESPCKRFIHFSVFSTTDVLPFVTEEGTKVRNGIFEYYVGEIYVETKFLSDSELWDFVYKRHQ